MKNIVFISILVFTFSSCDPNEKVYHPDLREAVENRKIKQIHEPDILARASQMGENYALISEKTLGKALKTTIKQSGISDAIAFCNVSALPLLSQLQDTNNVSIKRVSFKLRNSKNKANELENQLLDAFHYNIENNIDITPSVQKSGEDYYYVKPIYVKDMCLQCHGTPEKEIASENFEKLKKLYPEGKAINYKAGDLRGMWSIKIPKKQIVLSLSDDTWKYKYEKKDKK